jgi:AcrR family transcriptional regulator
MTTMASTVGQAVPKKLGLRERKKLRTRETIERVALDLFATRGFQATTLLEIADRAEIAPSTLHGYFPSKDAIVFSRHDAVRESAKNRVAERPAHEDVIQALQSWVSDDVPAIVGDDGELTRRRRLVIDSDDALLLQERLRSALLEDVFATAFARDLGETADDLRSRLMASITVSGLRAISFWWYRQPAGDPREPYRLDETYLTTVIRAAERALEAIPGPPAALRDEVSAKRSPRRQA